MRFLEAHLALGKQKLHSPVSADMRYGVVISFLVIAHIVERSCWRSRHAGLRGMLSLANSVTENQASNKDHRNLRYPYGL